MADLAFEDVPEESCSTTSLEDTGFFTLDDELIGKVVEIHPTNAFSYPRKTEQSTEKKGRVRNIILENEEHKECDFPFYRYRLVLWGNQIDKFSLDADIPYTITRFKQVLNNKKKAPGMYPFDIHLQNNSKISLYEK